MSRQDGDTTEVDGVSVSLNPQICIAVVASLTIVSKAVVRTRDVLVQRGFTG